MGLSHYVYYQYLDISNESLFTLIMLPQKEGKFPTIVCRTPYVKSDADKSEEELMQSAQNWFQKWIERGYAVIFQHCRGQGKSTGAFVPYVHEREDGLALREWIRKQPFYNGELYLFGENYTASLHYATAPFTEEMLHCLCCR